MGAGAIAGYAIQVGENRSEGMEWGEALITNISLERIWAGALTAGGAIIGAAGLSIGLSTLGITIGEASTANSYNNDAITVEQAAQSVWKLNPFARGIQIEESLGRSPELTQNFPVVDRWENGVATSIKSIDLSAKSYQNIPTLMRTVQGYVNNLKKFNGTYWGGFRIRPDEIVVRELILVIPPNTASSIQLQALAQIQQFAFNRGVNMIIQTTH